MKTVTMSEEMFYFLQETRAIKMTGINYKLGRYVVVVDSKRKGLNLVVSKEQ